MESVPSLEQLINRVLSSLAKRTAVTIQECTCQHNNKLQQQQQQQQQQQHTCITVLVEDVVHATKGVVFSKSGVTSQRPEGAEFN